MNEKKKAKILTAELRKKMESLSPKEKDYFLMMWAKSGVLYLTSKPGVAKSAILREIAAKMEFNYIDIRLSMRDETDVGLYPVKVEINGKQYLDFLTPLWAHLANDCPTIIHFEELNRAEKPVRNAALQLLLDRIIGSAFAFNNMVLMCASGNLGEEDGTEVDDFDQALNNRLIHVNHFLEPEEWLENFANDNIHYSICEFIKSQPEYMYRDPSDSNGNKPKAFATPRTWEFLSDFIVSTYGCEAEVDEFIEDVARLGGSYVGASILGYIEFCRKLVKFSIQDVINRFDEIKEQLKNANRDRITQLVQNLKLVNIENLQNIQRENIHKFLQILAEDEMTDYLLGFLDKREVEIGVNTKSFLKKYEKILLKVTSINLKNNEELSFRKKKSTNNFLTNTNKKGRSKKVENNN
jgi:hypothetical protein